MKRVKEELMGFLIMGSFILFIIGTVSGNNKFGIAGIILFICICIFAARNLKRNKK